TLAMPFAEGSFHRSMVYLGNTHALQESAVTGYVGGLALLVLAPLGFCHKRLRAMWWFWLGLGFWGAGYVFNIPGLQWTYDLPPLHTLRNNRLILLTGFGVLVMACIGADGLLGRAGARSFTPAARGAAFAGT